MSSGSWPPPVPARLRDRVGTLLAHDAVPTPAALMAAALVAARPLVQDAAAGREVALDLLAADALVTHALERMADNPGQFVVGCERAISDLSHLAGAR